METKQFQEIFFLKCYYENSKLLQKNFKYFHYRKISVFLLWKQTDKSLSKFEFFINKYKQHTVIACLFHTCYKVECRNSVWHHSWNLAYLSLLKEELRSRMALNQHPHKWGLLFCFWYSSTLCILCIQVSNRVDKSYAQQMCLTKFSRLRNIQRMILLFHL